MGEERQMGRKRKRERIEKRRKGRGEERRKREETEVRSERGNNDALRSNLQMPF